MKGRYLKRAFLLALADEIGHDTYFAENIPIAPGDDNEPESDDSRDGCHWYREAGTILQEVR